MFKAVEEVNRGLAPNIKVECLEDLLLQENDIQSIYLLDLPCVDDCDKVVNRDLLVSDQFCGDDVRYEAKFDERRCWDAVDSLDRQVFVCECRGSEQYTRITFFHYHHLLD